MQDHATYPSTFLTYLHSLTDDADGLLDELEPPHDADVFGSAAGGPQADQVLHSEERDETNLLREEMIMEVISPLGHPRRHRIMG